MSWLKRLLRIRPVGYFCDITLFAPDGKLREKETVFIEDGKELVVKANTGELMKFRFKEA